MSTSWSREQATQWLARPSASEHKVSRGVVAACTGSAAYPGAAVLSVSAAWRTGIGMVRFVPEIDPGTTASKGMPSPESLVLAARPETVISVDEPVGVASAGDPADESDDDDIDGVRVRATPKLPADAWIIGSGTDPALRSEAETARLRALLGTTTPVIVDAGALPLLGEQRVAPALATPHAGEFSRLWKQCGLGDRVGLNDSADRSAAVSRLAAHLDCTILLKGSITTIAAPSGRVLRVGPATPWLATAGTGDVLAGIVGALAARHAAAIAADPDTFSELAATAALLHDVAARIASNDLDAEESETGQAITALDVAEAIPSAISALAAAPDVPPALFDYAV